jgi:hypothetical protein
VRKRGGRGGGKESCVDCIERKERRERKERKRERENFSEERKGKKRFLPPVVTTINRIE